MECGEREVVGGVEVEIDEVRADELVLNIDAFDGGGVAMLVDMCVVGVEEWLREGDREQVGLCLAGEGGEGVLMLQGGVGGGEEVCGVYGMAHAWVYMWATRLPMMQERAEPCLTPQGYIVRRLPKCVIILTELF